MTPETPRQPTKVHTCEIEVRGYELDGYGHVNHAVYVSYLEFARWKALQSVGIGIEDFKRWQRWPVIGHLEASYRKPCFAGDLLRIETQVQEWSRVKFKVRQKIYRGNDLVLEALVTAIIVNELGRPAPLPKEIARLWSEESDGGGGGDT